MPRKKMHHHKPHPDDKRHPHDRFRDLSKHVVNVPKDTIDARDKAWQHEKDKK